jgi:glycosyltransferase involved in cell wall biosynthesis
MIASDANTKTFNEIDSTHERAPVARTKTARNSGAEVMSQQRVGIVMPLGCQQGGAEALLQHLLRHHPHDHEYRCAFLEEGPLVDEVRDLGYDTTVFPTTHLSHLGNYLTTVRALRSWIRTEKVRLVFSWMPKAHIYVSLASLFLPVRVVWFQHGVPYGHPIDRLITLLPANAVLCCSRSSKRGQDQMFPERRSLVCYPGVALLSDKKTVSQDDARQCLKLSTTGAVVGMVSRLEHWKGAHIFVEAAAAILKRYPKATFFIVGGEHKFDVPYAQKVHSMVRDLNIGNQFILAGQRPLSEVPLWQAAADVIAHPVVGVEPFGMSVVEAMGQGKAVVASDIGGPAEVIENGVSGILIRGGDSSLLASTVIQLLDDSARRLAIEKQAYLRARSFSVDVFAARFNELIGELLTP